MQLHWEADALWMLTEAGITVDLLRGKDPSTADLSNREKRKKFSYNYWLHGKIVRVYEKVFNGNEMAAFGFINRHLYRSNTGHNIAMRLRKALFDQNR